ncbi:MAG TPA: GNAT family N-acetyltransferase [Candidatus Saccharimonadia bacterium]|nr:GNAT family N-acetyltransferase [Candidatus Saccharimonadia bacterium]
MNSTVNPEIRHCKESDLPKLQTGIPSGSHQKRFDKQLAGTAEYLIAWVNDKPAGFFLLDYQGQQYLPGIPEIRDGEVTGRLRSRGIGSALIHECEKRAKLHGSNKVSMLVARDNPRARQLYKKLGYRDSGIQDVATEYDDTNAADETNHSLNQLKVRSRITKQMVINAINDPDKVIESYRGRKLYQKAFEADTLEVVARHRG